MNEMMTHSPRPILRTLLASIVLLAACTAGPDLEQASPTRDLAQQVRSEFSGDRALETVAYLDQFVRWPGNRGFDASIRHVAEGLEAAGYVEESPDGMPSPLWYRVESYPMDTPAWEPVAATVTLAGGDTLLDLSTNRNMLARMSHATPADGDSGQLVDIGDRTEVDCGEVEGHIVLANQNAGRLWRRMSECDLVGVLGYSLADYLQPEVNQTSIQFTSIPYSSEPTWAIAVSFEAQTTLREALQRGEVNLEVSTDVVWTENAQELTVVAGIRGAAQPSEEFVFSAHVQEPGANDNASGVGAQLEMARVAAALVQGDAVAPDRSLVFLWGQEIRSTARYIEQDSVRAEGIKWGISLDMVGENTEITGGTFLVEKMPDPSAVWTRGDDKHTEWGGRPMTLEQMMPHYLNDYILNRARETALDSPWVVGANPYEGGSDHVPFLRADIPSVLLWHFTDQFYHTDQDRLDKVSSDELARVGRTALVAALGLVTADQATTTGIFGELEAVAAERLQVEAILGQAAIAEGASRESQEEIINAWADWYSAAFVALRDLEPIVVLPGAQYAGAEARLREREKTAIAQL